MNTEEVYDSEIELLIKAYHKAIKEETKAELKKQVIAWINAKLRGQMIKCGLSLKEIRELFKECGL